MLKINDLVLEEKVVIKRGVKSLPDREEDGKTFPNRMIGLVTNIDESKKRVRAHFYYKEEPYWLWYNAKDLTIAPEQTRG
ncbi:MAG: hypothetical protein AABW51_01590 [Nanoarchaeota archaeon]